MSKTVFFVLCMLTGALATLNIIDVYRKEVFNIAILKNQKPVVVYYTSKACTICEKLYSKLEEKARDNSEKMYLAKVDFDKLPVELKETFDIQSIPTTRSFYKGRKLDEVKGPKWLDIRVLFDEVLV